MNKKYQNIQLLRIFSCIGVFLTHLGQQAEFTGILRKVTNFGANGVYLFFIISGFVTFLSLDNKKTTTKKYYFNRFIRIAPTYYFVVIFYCFLYTFIVNDIPEDFLHLGWLRYFLCLNIIVPNKDNSLWGNIGGLWTIFIFMLFYLLVPLLRKWCINLKTSVVLWGILFSFSFLNIPNMHNIIYPLHNIHYFLIGVIAFHAIKEQKRETLLLVCSILIVGRGIIYPVIDMPVWISLFITILLASTFIQVRNPTLCAIIDKLDEYSYTIYLVHCVIINLIAIYKINTTNGDWKYVVTLMAFGGTIILSIIVHEIIEKPIQIMLKRILL